MPKNWKDIQARVAKLPRKELEGLLLMAMKKHADVFEYVWINYLDKEYGRQDLYEQYLADINGLLAKGYRGRSDELRAAASIDACKKHLDNFTKAGAEKDKALDLALFVLEHSAVGYPDMAGTCFTRYDYAYYMLFKRAKSLYYGLHSDLQLDYRSRLQAILSKLKRHSSHLNYVYDLEETI
jgi:hypothetical protein